MSYKLHGFLLSPSIENIFSKRDRRNPSAGKGLVACFDPVQHHSPLHAYADLYSLIFISKGHLLLGTCVCLFRESHLMGKDFSFLYWYRHGNEFICSSELITLLSLTLASFTCLQHIVIVRHAAYTSLCTQSNSSWQQLIFLAAAFFSEPPVVCTDVQSAVRHSRCHSTCITL